MLAISHYFDFSLDLTLAGAVGGLNRMFCAQTRRTAAAAVENRFHFVENGRLEQTNFQKIPTQPFPGIWLD